MMLRVRRLFCLSLLAVLALTASPAAQQRVKVFIGEIKGPDQFISDRFALLFMEELSKLRSVELVKNKETADVLLEGLGRLRTLQQGSVSGTSTEGVATVSGSAGDTPNALLSVTVTDLKSERILFVGNKSVRGGRKGATHEAVIAVVKDLKKKLKWK